MLAATRSESGAEPKGAILVYSVCTTLALFRCGPSSPSVASSAADVLPVSAGFFRGLPLGLPVGCRLRDALEEGRDPDPDPDPDPRPDLSGSSVGCGRIGADSRGVSALMAVLATMGGMLDGR